MTTFEEITEKVKSFDDIENVYLHDMHEFTIEETINRKGKLRVVLSFNAEELLVNPKSIASRRSDYKLVPIIMFLRLDRTKSKNKNDKKKEKKGK